VVGVAECSAGLVDDPDAEQVGGGERPQQREIRKMRMEQVEAEPCEQRAEGAGRLRREAAAAAEGEEVRRVGEEELDAGRGSGGFSRNGRSLAG
jgi:hypothetical protein